MDIRVLSAREVEEAEVRARNGASTKEDVFNLIHTVRQFQAGKTNPLTVSPEKRKKKAPAYQKTSRSKQVGLVEIFTDGACKGNPGPGGWGAIVRTDGEERELSGAVHDTTNNRMEMAGAIEALKSLQIPCKVELTTDSTYLKDGITKWIIKWRDNGWRTSARKAVKNDDLWRKLDELSQKHRIDWCWVSGHSGHPENERCDELANLAILQL